MFPLDFKHMSYDQLLDAARRLRDEITARGISVPYVSHTRVEHMPRTPVPLQPSSSLHAAAYDADTRDLDLTFSNGRTYTLRNVPPDVADGLSAASSPGSYFNSNLKGQY